MVTIQLKSLPTSSTFLLLAISTAAAVAAVAAAATSTNDFDFSLAIEKMIHLHFYMHDTIHSPNATVVKVVTNPTNASLFTFGVISAIDDLLTEGPNLSTSKLVGRAQGLYTYASLQGKKLWTVNFVFVEEEYNGSTLTVVAMDDVFEAVRELPIVSGTGYFRLARGFALLKTYHLGDAILELDVYVMHR